MSERRMIWSPESTERLKFVDARIRMGDREFAGVNWQRYSAYDGAPDGIVHAVRDGKEPDGRSTGHRRICYSEQQIYPSHWPSKTFVCKICVLKLMREFRL